MNTERREMHATVREGYQILLRANVTLFLPIDKPKICKFYQKTAKINQKRSYICPTTYLEPE